MKCNGLNMAMVQGDSDAVIVNIHGREFKPGDVVTMTVRKAMGKALFVKEVRPQSGTKVLFDIFPSDTKNGRPGDYDYDIQIAWGGEVVQTVIPKATFTIIGEVTR